MGLEIAPMDICGACPVCESGDTHSFFELENIPVNVCVQWPSREKAIACPRGDIRLLFCEGCGFIWNSAFDAARLDYTQAYENSLFFSPLFQDYSNVLVRRLIDRYGLKNKQVIEIGCGKGDFLLLLCKMGDNRGIGFDTSYEGGADDERITIIRDFYSPKYSNYKGDLVCSRYVFEHIEKPRGFLEEIRRTIDEKGSIVYFEVPNVALILQNLSIWDVIYEHCSYFGIESLTYIFKRCGFAILDVYEGYGGQFVGIEARPSDTNGNIKSDAGKVASDVESFVYNYRKQLELWQVKLDAIDKAGKKAVVWGAGAKGVSFLNMLKLGEKIEYIVDINPRKHGRHIAGAGQKIISPEFLSSYKPDYIILPNPIYRDEVGKTIKALGVSAEIL
jgi:SAM-dependent methyltransferase